MDNLRERMGAFGRVRVEGELQWSVVGQNLLRAYAHLGMPSANLNAKRIERANLSACGMLAAHGLAYLMQCEKPKHE